MKAWTRSRTVSGEGAWASCLLVTPDRARCLADKGSLRTREAKRFRPPPGESRKTAMAYSCSAPSSPLREWPLQKRRSSRFSEKGSNTGAPQRDAKSDPRSRTDMPTEALVLVDDGKDRGVGWWFHSCATIASDRKTGRCVNADNGAHRLRFILAANVREGKNTCQDGKAPEQLA